MKYYSKKYLASSAKPKMSGQLKGLNIMLNYHRITGNTYFGWNYNKKISTSRKVMAFMWNMVILTIQLIFTLLMAQVSLSSSQDGQVYSQVNKTMETTCFQDSNQTKKPLIVYILFSSSTFLFTFQTIIIYIYMIIFGGKILDNLSRSKLRMAIPEDKSFVIKYLLARSLYIIISITLHIILSWDTGPATSFKDMDIAIAPLFLLGLALSISHQVVVNDFLVYKCFTVNKQFKQILETNVSNDLDLVYKTVYKLNDSLTEFNRCISPMLLLNLFLYSLMSVSSICQLALMSNVRREHNLLSVVVSVLLSAFLCFVCNTVPQSVSSLTDKLESRYLFDRHNQSMDPNDKQTILQLRELSARIGLTAMGLFRINANTLLSCLALIVTYSVIIIQV